MIPTKHTAACAPMDSISESLRDVHAALGAQLRRAVRVHRDDVHASFFRFAVQDRDELSPSGVVDALGEHPSCEASDVEVLVHNQVEPRAEHLRELAVEVESMVADLGVCSTDGLLGTAPTLASTLLQGEDTLRSCKARSATEKVSRIGDRGSIREHGEVSQTKVDPGDVAGTDSSLRRRIADVADDPHGPAVLRRVVAELDIAHDTVHRTVLSEAHSPEKRHANVPATTLVLRPVDCNAADPERVVPVARPETRVSRLLPGLASTKESLACSVEPAQRRTMHSDRNAAIVGLASQVRQIATLVDVRDRLPSCPPSRSPLLERRVVERAALETPTVEFCPLRCERSQDKAIGAQHQEDATVTGILRQSQVEACRSEASGIMRRDLWWEVTSVCACASLFGLWTYELGRSNAIWWVIVVGIFTASVVADFVSGVIHWTWDTWGSERFWLVGRVFIRPFREHHVDPMAITRHDFFEVTGASALVMAPVFVLSWLLAFSTSQTGLFASVSLGTVATLMVMTNQLHKWAHAGAPAAVRVLQRCGLVISPEAHAQHHERPFWKNYCITHGWWNPILDGLSFFRGLERVVTAMTGAVPRAEDGTLMADPETETVQDASAEDRSS